ncbi:MAG TPA: class I SAM-dependent methyltransferase [Acidimicrobiales bacterium]|nr:class I SAM-dependent methyltransferase [Acidimicrobiales bacterium]
MNPTTPAGPAFENGHFYSPVVDTADVESRSEEIWPPKLQLPGIDFDISRQQKFLAELSPFMAEYDFPEKRVLGQPERFSDLNGTFERVDARVLYGLLRSRQPRRFIEVGSGMSSLLAGEVNSRFLGGSVEVTCIEPEPADVLRSGLAGIGRVLARTVQTVPTDEFLLLEAGDVLFIDSSHVSKTGSDVNHLVFRVLPYLAEGVLIHFHDIFLPADYPYQWVVEEGRSWNEQYVVQALLMFSSRFEVEFAAAFASVKMPDFVASALAADFGDARPPWGGSLWLRVAG